MKYKDHTVSITQITVRICYGMLAGAMLAFPFIIRSSDAAFFGYLVHYGRYLILPFYLVCPAGYAALISLDRLLANIKKDIVFEEKNIRLLNLLTYSCIYAAGVGVVSFIVIAVIFIPFDLLFVLILGEAFMALVVRVVRNVFKKAIEIKEENDLTV